MINQSSGVHLSCLIDSTALDANCPTVYCIIFPPEYMLSLFESEIKDVIR